MIQNKTSYFLLFLIVFIYSSSVKSESLFKQEYMKLRDSFEVSPKNALQETREYLKANEEKLSQEETGRILFLLARIHLALHNIDEAIATIEEYKKIITTLEDERGFYNYHQLYSGIYDSLDLPKLALESLEKSYSIALKRNTYRAIVLSEFNIGSQYIKLELYDKAKDYIKRYYDNAIKVNVVTRITYALTSFADIEYQQGNYKESLKFNFEALTIRKDNDITFEQYTNYLNIAKNHFKLGSIEQTKEYLFKARAILEAENNIDKLNLVNVVFAEVYMYENEYSKAIDLTSKIALYSIKSNQYEIAAKALKIKADGELKIGKAEDAYLTLLSYNEIVNKRLIKQKKLAISFLLNQQDSLTKDYKLAQAKQEKILTQEQNASTKTLLFSIICFSLLIIIVTSYFIVKLRHKNKESKSLIAHLDQTLETLHDTQDKLLEVEKMKSLTTLVSGLAHQLNTPLGIITTAISSLQDKLKTKKKELSSKTLTANSLNEFFEYSEEITSLADESTKKTSGLITRFKMISAELEKTEVSSFEFTEFVKETLVSIFHEQTVPVSVKTSVIGDLVEVTNYRGCWIKILSQLVENSITHGFNNISKPKIKIQVISTDNDLIVTYSDNGIGIDGANSTNIFTPFYTTSLGQGSLGLGLNIVYNAVVHMMGGEITSKASLTGIKLEITVPRHINV